MHRKRSPGSYFQTRECNHYKIFRVKWKVVLVAYMTTPKTLTKQMPLKLGNASKQKYKIIDGDALIN